MSATMARQGGRVQLEQSDLRVALNTAKMAKGGFLCAAIEETQSPMKKPHTEVKDEQKWGVEFLGHRKVKAAMERHSAMLHQNHTNRCLHCPNAAATNLQTQWTHKWTGAPPPDRHRQPTLESTPSLPPSDNEGGQRSKINNLPPGYVYSHTPLPSTQFFNLVAYAQDSQPNTDYNPDMLTDKGTSTG